MTRNYITAAANRARWTGLRRAEDLGRSLLTHYWWLLKARADEPFILGDAPVFGTVAIGHDAGWTRLIDEDVYTVIFPFTPDLALLFASRGILPGVLKEPEEMGRWINEISWSRAATNVIARQSSELDRVKGRVTNPQVTVYPFVDIDLLRIRGAIIVCEFMTREQWRWRDLYRPRCRATSRLHLDETSVVSRTSFS